KKEQSISDVPISISAFSGEFLRDAAIDNLHELAEFAPNVRLTTNACCTTVFIRGFGNPFGGSVFDPTVGLALDELSIPKDIYMSDPLYDIERFEVLRGPQGTLFGKNTPAGLFNVTTGSPTDEFSGFVLGRAGSLGVHRFEAAVGGPLGAWGDVARFRLAVMDAQQAGDVRNTFLDVDEPATQQHAGRLKLELTPVDSLEVLLIGEIATTDSRFFHVQQHSLRDSSVQFLRRFDPDFEDDGLNHQDSINIDGDLLRRTHRLQSNVRWSHGDVGFVRDAETVAIIGFTGFDQDAPGDVDWSPARVVSLADPNRFDYQQFSGELRFAGLLPGLFGFGEIELLAGYLWFDSKVLTDARGRAGEDFDEYVLSAPAFELITGSEAPGGVGLEDLTAVTSALGLDPLAGVELLKDDGFRFRSRQSQTSSAFFGRAAWHLTEEWTLDLGGRLTLEDKDARLINQCFDPGVVCAALGVEEFVLDKKRSETDFSPKVTLHWAPWGELSLFATRAQGFKSGGFNNFSFTSGAIEVDEEQTVSWEVGAKGRALAETLSYGVTLFNMEVDDMQLQNLTGGVVQVRNAASARSRGVELDFQWLTPWEPLSFRGAGAYTDGKFTSFPDAPAPASSGVETQDLTGRRMPFSPKVQLAVTPEVRVPFAAPAALSTWVSPDLAAALAFDVLYRSAQYLDVDLDPNTRQDGYAMLDGRFMVGTADGRLTLQASVENITNTDAFELKLDSLFYPGGYMGMQEFQRRWTFEMRFAW
ncbi:MAG: TonB-dependent receptor, partial [Candidatus Binatia bacterium]